MVIFLRSQFASFAASAGDFLLTYILAEWLGLWYGIASVCGNITGGVVNFTIGRYWTFQSIDSHVSEQALRYLAVWLGYLLINFLLLVIAKDILQLHYMLAKVSIAVVLGIYNYLLQRTFVFR